MLKVTVWGSRGSIPVSGKQFGRYGGATTCVEIELQNSQLPTPPRVIIDCGSGLAELGKNWEERSSKALLLQTHMHWDHIQGFPFFSQLFNPNAEFEFWAVPREDHSFREVLSKQMTKPTFPIGIDILPSQLTFRNINTIGESTIGDLKLAWTELCHPSGSTAYRLSYHGTDIVFTGDVEVQQGSKDRLIEFAKGADLLIMDSQYLPDEYESRKGFGHSTPKDAVEVAVTAGVGQLLMTHHDPSHDDEKLDSKLSLARDIAGDRVLVESAFDRYECKLSGRSSGISI